MLFIQEVLQNKQMGQCQLLFNGTLVQRQTIGIARENDSVFKATWQIAWFSKIK